MSYSRYYKCPLYKRNKFGNKDGLVLKTDFVFFFFFYNDYSITVRRDSPSISYIFIAFVAYFPNVRQ